jgi:hypothetical protein
MPRVVPVRDEEIIHSRKMENVVEEASDEDESSSEDGMLDQ